MNETKENIKNVISYENATGPIEFPLTSDIVFHYIMQNSEKALTGLICALKGITPADVKKVLVKNPISLNNLTKETVLDLLLTLNNNETMNIEVQVYEDKYWISRSILYLCRAYDNLKGGDNYSLLKSTMHYCITDQNLLPNNNEFYSHYRLLNSKNHAPYTDKFGINVLQLNHIDKATEDDISNNLVYWAKLFKANTWGAGHPGDVRLAPTGTECRQFKALAKDNPAIEEVGNMILELNTDDVTREMLEGQRRYREMFDTQYVAGYTDAEEKLNPIIADREATIAEQSAALADKDVTIANKDATIADKDATIADIESQLQKYKQKYGDLS
ncbi:Rpn family recombination-promoting nuclease/putative transposase [Butyrivibrio sp. WCD3002]|uniref:Rpn family recombination-promoting nuclease/putative transposase n=1 Tax=Butyrivibrio sp. WCD3002 TaxID=1280676 RepID=UPI000425CE0A|nr:Rpn family recombination-promoting nuclease/putative transposase [Butyrivibrio sp. WCD3002]